MSTYTWKITDPSLVRSMKHAKNGSQWRSPIFAIGGFRWYLKVYPNGNQKDNNGYVELYLFLAFLPPKVKSLQIEQKLRLIETDTINSTTKTCKEGDMNCGWPFKTLETKKLEYLTTFTFSAEIKVYGVFDHEDNDVTNEYINTNNEESKHSPSQSVKQSDSLINSVD
eukprot:88548_1